MNRRDFARAFGGAVVASAAWRAGATPAGLAPPLPAAEPPLAPFKLSVMLWTVFPKLPFDERLEKVAQAGYRAVELVGEFGKWSPEQFRQANRKKTSLGITFDATAGAGRRSGLADPSARPGFLNEVREMLKVMDKLECPALIVLSGNKVPQLSREAQHQSCIEGLQRAAELVEKTNFSLLLENIDPEENPNYYLTSSAEGFEVVKNVNHPRVKFLYDLFHEQIAEGNLIEKLEKNIDRVGLIHVADVPGRHEPGTGEINYRNIFKRLAQLNYPRYVAMEFIPTGDPVQSLAAAREMALKPSSE